MLARLGGKKYTEMLIASRLSGPSPSSLYLALTNGSIASIVVAISIFSFLVFAGSSRTCRSLVEVAGERSSLSKNFFTSLKVLSIL